MMEFIQGLGITIGFAVVLMTALFLAHIVIDGNPEHYPINLKGFWRWFKKASQPTPL